MFWKQRFRFTLVNAVTGKVDFPVTRRDAIRHSEIVQTLYYRLYHDASDRHTNREKVTMMRSFDFLTLFLCSALALTASAVPVQVQKKASTFVIDQAEPYVYLKFDHIGKRQPLSSRETDKGLWIRLANNCRVPIIVVTFDPETKDPGSGVYDEIVPVDLNAPPLGHGVRAGENASTPAQERNETIPEGYSAGDVLATTTIAPGTSLLLNLPANHVGPSWRLQIRFYFDLPRSSYGSGPYGVVSFGWQDIPEKFRESTKP